MVILPRGVLEVKKCLLLNFARKETFWILIREMEGRSVTPAASILSNDLYGKSPVVPFYGSLSVYYGSMKSGKTSKLLSLVDGCIYSGKNVLYVSSVLDTREIFNGHEAVSSHRLHFIPTSTTFHQIKVDLLEEVKYDTYDTIFVDECQFFKDLVVTCLKWIRNGVDVVVAGLDLTYEGTPFGQTLNLVQYATHVKKLYGCCEVCKRLGYKMSPNSTHTYRLGKTSDLIVIDDSRYEVCCFYHFENYPERGDSD